MGEPIKNLSCKQWNYKKIRFIKTERMKKSMILLLIAFQLYGMGADRYSPTQKIMVIPYTKQGEDISQVIENDVNKRIVLAKIREAFDSRGFTTVDFAAKT